MTDYWLESKLCLIFKSGLTTLDGQHFHFVGPFDDSEDAVKWLRETCSLEHQIRLALTNDLQVAFLAIPMSGELPEEIKKKREAEKDKSPISLDELFDLLGFGEDINDKKKAH